MEIKKAIHFKLRKNYEDDIVQFLAEEKEKSGVSTHHTIKEAIRFYRDNKHKVQFTD